MICNAQQILEGYRAILGPTDDEPAKSAIESILVRMARRRGL
jgi:hypothetical protein